MVNSLMRDAIIYCTYTVDSEVHNLANGDEADSYMSTRL